MNIGLLVPPNCFPFLSTFHGRVQQQVLHTLQTVMFVCDILFPQAMSIEDGRAGKRTSRHSW